MPTASSPTRTNWKCRWFSHKPYLHWPSSESPSRGSTRRSARYGHFFRGYFSVSLVPRHGAGVLLFCILVPAFLVLRIAGVPAPLAWIARTPALQRVVENLARELTGPCFGGNPSRRVVFGSDGPRRGMRTLFVLGHGQMSLSVSLPELLDRCR